MAKKKGMGKWIGNAVFVLLALFVLSMLFFRKENGMTYTGFAAYAVLSNSMSPTFYTGSMVVVKSVKPESLKVDDILTYQATTDPKVLVTHRIIEIVEENGKLNFLTQGDANNVADFAPVTTDRVVGKVLFWLPGVGHLASYLTPILAAILGILLVFILFPGGKRKKEESAEALDDVPQMPELEDSP